jgi:hypothetical protein
MIARRAGSSPLLTRVWGDEVRGNPQSGSTAPTIGPGTANRTGR